MINLNIDFDGVIIDDIPTMYNELKNKGIARDDQVSIREFFSKYDFSKVVKDELILNDSIKFIQKLIDSNKFNISILSHVVSLEEAVIKIKYIRKYFKDITVIIVPREISKTDMVHTENSILVDDFAGNLREWEEKGGISVRFNMELESKGFRVINKLDQLLEMF